jgi:putative hydrolase of the HAD superfamily
VNQIFKDVRWLFFDVGSTLMDETAAHEARGLQVVNAMADLGVSITSDEWAAAYEDAFSWALNRMLEHAVMKLGLTESDADVARSKTSFDRSLEVPYPHALETVSALARHYSAGIIANQDPGMVERLRVLGIDQYFDIVLGSGDIGLSKPNPEIFRRALLLSGCPPKQTAMIGDRTGNDIIPAKTLGMKTIRVRQGFTHSIEPTSQPERPDAEVEAIADLAGLLGG